MIPDYTEFDLSSDRYVFVKFGRELDMERHFETFAFAETIEGDPPPGIVNVVPCVCTVMLEYDVEETSGEAVLEYARDVVDEMGGLESFTSRLVEIPILFDDPWSFECSRAFKNDSETWERDLEFVARKNDFDSVEAFIEFFVEPQHQVITVGFTPGVATTYMLGRDRDEIPTAPRYRRPRPWTPEGTIGFGGRDTSFYAKRTPGGNYMIGRTPVPVYHPEMELDVFAAEGTSVLLQGGDRVKFIPVDLAEFIDVRERIENNIYEYNIAEQDFDPGEYLERSNEYMTSLEERARTDFSVTKYVDEPLAYMERELDPVYEGMYLEDPIREVE